MENVGIFYGHGGYFTVISYGLFTIWYIVWSFGTFFPFGYVVPREIWQP
jgi:hypothetical protein